MSNVDFSRLVKVPLDHGNRLWWVLGEGFDGKSEKVGQIATFEGAVECGQGGRKQRSMGKRDELAWGSGLHVGGVAERERY